jgi:pimeloyl-ACP methyl ester carboxylesterase
VLGVIPASIALFWRAVGGRWLKLVNEVHFRARYGDELAKQQIEAGFFFDAMQDALRQLRGKDFLRELKRYPGPVLLLNGEKDSLYRLSELLFLAAAQDARLQFVRGAGHVANLEKPEAYNKAVRTFARSVEW